MTLDKTGRRYIYFGNGKRAYYARMLGCIKEQRVLTSDDVVHHINGDWSDDRLENLQIMTRSAHGRLHGLRENRTRAPKRNDHELRVFSLRMSQELKTRMARDAEKNYRSLNQEIIIRLERSLREDEAPRQHL